MASRLAAKAPDQDQESVRAVVANFQRKKDLWLWHILKILPHLDITTVCSKTKRFWRLPDKSILWNKQYWIEVTVVGLASPCLQEWAEAVGYEISSALLSSRSVDSS